MVWGIIEGLGPLQTYRSHMISITKRDLPLGPWRHDASANVDQMVTWLSMETHGEKRN